MHNDPKDRNGAYAFPEIRVSQPSAKRLSDDWQATPESLEEKVRAAEAKAYEEGYHQERTKALPKEMAAVQALKTQLDGAVDTLAVHRQRMRTMSEEALVNLGMAMAREILQQEMRQHPERLASVFRKVLSRAAGQSRVRVKAHPDDCDLARRILTEVVPDGEDGNATQVIPDPALVRGGCLVETDFGTIDARLDRQLAVIGENVQGTLAEIKGEISAGTTQARSNETVAERLTPYRRTIESTTPVQVCGHVTQVVGLVVEANGPVVQLGAICDIHGSDGERPIAAEVLGFRDRTVLMMPLEEIRTIGPGSRVVARQGKAAVAVGPKMLGRIIDGLGVPIDNRGPLETEATYPIYANPINPLLRQRIRTPLDMGIRAINGLITVGCGQRMGIFAGSGVGKSVLMGMIARNARADVNVIALIGERGRELNDFIEKDLGEEGLRKSVVVVATSDHLPLVRVRGAFLATAIAEYFRDQGMTVNLMMDSLTRFAMAQREIGLALGEPPTTKGYTPSVLTMLPRLLERAGTSDHEGTITGLYTVLVEGDDMNEPIADAARSILDGHIVLSRALAHQNHYPAIDVLHSISRVMEDIASLKHKHSAGRVKEMLATYRKSEDLINIGAYVAGSNPAIDRAIAKIDAINGYLCQEIGESVGLEESVEALDQMLR